MDLNAFCANPNREFDTMRIRILMRIFAQICLTNQTAWATWVPVGTYRNIWNFKLISNMENNKGKKYFRETVTEDLGDKYGSAYGRYRYLPTSNFFLDN